MTIEINDNNGFIKIEIRDIFGTLKLSEINKNNQDCINVSSLPNGIYF
ncbi:MAG: T9SS type A sorting domain-containing protein [Saprospiraceae bacterium]|nr:T9SS type A sorting domain-containing protein [Saprospiraceae bacterium]